MAVGLVTPISASAAAGDGTGNITSAGSAGIRLETPALANGVTYFVMWSGCFGININATNTHAQGGIISGPAGEQVTGQTTHSTVVGKPSSGSSADEPWNARQMQGFTVITAGADTTVKYLVGAFSGARTYWSDLQIICIPLTGLVQNTDYWLSTLNGPGDTVAHPTTDSATPVSIEQLVATLPDDGDYLCCFQMTAIPATNTGTLFDKFSWKAEVDGVDLPVNVPSTGLIDGKNTSTLGSPANEPWPHGLAWYELRTLSSGSRTFELWGWDDANDEGPTFAEARIAVFRAASFLGGISQTKDTGATTLTSTSYGSVHSHTVGQTEGYHVAIAAAVGSGSTQTPNNAALFQLRNATSATTHMGDLGRANDLTVATDGERASCPIAVEDVTSLNGNITWHLDARQAELAGNDPIYNQTETGTNVTLEANLIVWNLGLIAGQAAAEPVVATPVVSTPTLVHPLAQTSIAVGLLTPPDAFNFPAIPVGIITSNTSDAGVLAIEAAIEGRGPGGFARTVTRYDETTVSLANMQAQAALVFVKNAESDPNGLVSLLASARRPAIIGYSSPGVAGSTVGLAQLLGLIGPLSEFASVDDPTIALASTSTALPPTDAFGVGRTLDIFRGAETIVAASSTNVQNAGSALLVDGSSRVVAVAADRGASNLGATSTFARRIAWLGYLSGTAGLGADGAAILSATLDWLVRFHDDNSGFPT